mmetsp:Transcript_27946/g.80026  ORF Transcript_27946/g.80026 Transcript_27946/m.80026 type:complete len:228 (+) Transcript_27946:751-1434(+)
MACRVQVRCRFGVEDGVEGRVIQVRIQTLQVLRRRADDVHDDERALVHGQGGGGALQVSHVGLRTRNHQGLGALHLDLHLPHGADLDGVSQGGARAVALPDRALGRVHPGFPQGTPDAFLLRGTVRRRHARAPSILSNLAASEVAPSLRVVGAGLEKHGCGAVAAVVAIGRGVEGEASAAWAQHVGRAPVDERKHRQRQARAQTKMPLERVPPSLQQVHLPQVACTQ